MHLIAVHCAHHVRAKHHLRLLQPVLLLQKLQPFAAIAGVAAEAERHTALHRVHAVQQEVVRSVGQPLGAPCYARKAAYVVLRGTEHRIKAVAARKLQQALRMHMCIKAPEHFGDFERRQVRMPAAVVVLQRKYRIKGGSQGGEVASVVFVAEAPNFRVHAQLRKGALQRKTLAELLVARVASVLLDDEQALHGLRAVPGS